MLLVRIQNGTAIVENILVISYKVKNSLTICPGNSTPICLSKIETYGNTKNVCVAALFIIAQNRKYSRCSSTREWINNGTFVLGTLPSNKKE